MKEIDIEPMKEVFLQEFSKFGNTFSKKLWTAIFAFFKSQTASLAQTAVSMGTYNGDTFKNNEQRLHRLMKNEEFEVEDKIWRSYLKIIFKLLEEINLCKEGDLIPLNVDFTTKTDEFLILSASIPFFKRGLPIYFSMRCYPKEKNQFDQKKMEEAFLRELKHLLSKKYRYVIVADRGFGNTRFIELCQKLDFNYVLRTQNNWNAEIEGEKVKLSSLPEEKHDLKAIISKKKIETRLITSFIDGSQGWYIFTDLNEAAYGEIKRHYENRFGCEKMFQDEKSSGFDIENSKVTDYSRFKRLLFCIYFAQALTMILGERLENKSPEISKIRKNIQRQRKNEISIFTQAKRVIIYFFEEAINILRPLFLSILSSYNSS